VAVGYKYDGKLHKLACILKKSKPSQFAGVGIISATKLEDSMWLIAGDRHHPNAFCGVVANETCADRGGIYLLVRAAFRFVAQATLQQGSRIPEVSLTMKKIPSQSSGRTLPDVPCAVAIGMHLK
jgi:hypothetical protein